MQEVGTARLKKKNKIFYNFLEKVLAKFMKSKYNTFCTAKVRGYSPIVQPVEHLTVNQGVVGSSPTRGANWPVGQAVKTPPFHGGIEGSIPSPVTNFGRLAQLGERLPYKQNVSGSIPLAPTM